MLLTQIVQNPDQIVLDDLSKQRTWRQLGENSMAVVGLLRDYGIEPGDRIALLMRNRVEYIEVVLGCLFAGVWLTPINWHLTDSEIGYILEDSNARLLFTEDYFTENIKATALSVVNIDQGALHATGSPSLSKLDLNGPAGGVMLYTSGTTGKPKGVKRAKPDSLEQALKQQTVAGAGAGLDGHGPHLVTGPLYHAAPMLYALYDMANGAELIIMPGFDAVRALQLIEERKVTHSHWVPTMFVRALRYKDQQHWDLSSLTLVLHGAAPITQEVKRELITWWGDVLVEYWGGSESGIVTRATSQQWLDHPGTVGKALPQFEVYTVNNHGERQQAGMRGVLAVPYEYHNAPEKTAESYLEPGVFCLGDIGTVDSEGYVYLLDRESHMIISGGVNIYPAEIESVLVQHPQVADAAVFGIPNDEWGEEVKAVIQLDSASYCTDNSQRIDNHADELLAFCREKLAAYKVPRSIDFIDQLPRYETGKLYVRRLKEPYWQGRKSQI